MATNLENKSQVKNLDTEEQRQEAVELLIIHTKISSEIRSLKSDLNDTRFPPTNEEKKVIEGAINVYVEKLEIVQAKIKETYNLDRPKNLDNELKKRSIDFRESKSQQEQDQLQRIAQQQDDAREDYMEKSAKTIEAAQDYIDKMKKLWNSWCRDEAQEIEAQKAFEAMQQANYELYQSYQRLMEVMGEKLPTQQQDANILSREIQEEFGAKKVDEISNFAQKYKLKEEEKKQQTQGKQQGQKRGLTHEMP